MGCLAISKGQEIPIFNEEDEKIFFFFLKDLPKEELLCPECDKVPEILNVHTDNGYIELKCKSHGKISMKIQEYYKKLDESSFKLKCLSCKKSQKELEELGIKLFYWYDCEQDLCENCKRNFENKEGQKLKHKSSNSDYCIEAKEKYNKCLQHYYEEITEYCLDCGENICEKERSRHEKHKKIKIKDYLEEAQKYSGIFETKNKYLEQIIASNKTIINNFLNYHNNYFYVKSVINVGKYLEEQFKRNSDEIESFVKELTKKKNEHKNAVKALKGKDIYLDGTEKKLYLNKLKDKRNIGNHELDLISKINFVALKEIHLSGNKISDINCLAHMKLPYLEFIDLSSNSIFEIDCFNNMILPYLEWIDLSDNKIQDIRPLTKLKETLKRIYLQNNQITDIKPFLDSDFPELEKLRIDSNQPPFDKASDAFNNLKLKYGEKLIYNEYGIKEFLKDYNINHDYSIRINGETFESEKKTIKDKIGESAEEKDIDKIVINDLNLDEKELNQMIKDLYLIIPKDNKIRKLSLQNNKIKDISLISRLYLPYLGVLDLSVNNLTNLNFLNEINFKILKLLFLDNNKINNVIPLDNYIESMYELYSNTSSDNNISNEPKLKLKIVCLCDNCFLIKEDGKGKPKDNNKDDNNNNEDKGKKIIVVDKEIKQYVENWEKKGIVLDIKKEENQ